jgi:glycine dehydrogenase
MKSSFLSNHLGPRIGERNEMLDVIGVKDVEELIFKTVPDDIRLKKELDLDSALTEAEYLDHIEKLGAKNKVFSNYIGLGYYDTLTPSVILRNIFENPGWYTAYTPYQAEIAQGRLEALLNYQTVVTDMTGLPIANASLLDEGTAAAESMIMFYNSRSRTMVKDGANKVFIDTTIFPQTIDILKTHADPKDIELVFGDYATIELDTSFFGAIVQFPAADGSVNDYRKFVAEANEKEIRVAVGSDLMSLALLTPPGEWGASVVFGNSQRFGVPMGYGGPHAGFFACSEDFKRHLPGRIIGVTNDRHGNRAYRMALQTREQHIKRERATSNICTAQALLAIMAGMYAVYHGPATIKSIAHSIHTNASKLEKALAKLGVKNENKVYFDTLKLTLDSESDIEKVRKAAEEAHINFNYFTPGHIIIAIDEATSDEDLEEIVGVFSKALGKEKAGLESAENSIPEELQRKSDFLSHDVFNIYRSETAMMRYIKRLENKDFSLVHGMIPLGSCTMKLNAASELIPLSSKQWNGIHPFVPKNQTEGYQEMFKELERSLSIITGFDAVSLQPNSGAQGEFAGLMVIRAYHLDRGDNQRNVVLIPSSAHGTNPASAAMAGMKIVIVACDDDGNIRIDDLKEKAEANRDNLSAFMVTYPSTHGVYEKDIKLANKIIHDNGGLVYMDGANMNAQVGLTNPGNIDADVCHLNLHKTFAIPHGGGGPGVGPIGVAKHLTPYLPGNPLIETGGDKAITAISAAPWGSALVTLISYAYIKMLGAEGLKESSVQAIINANYLRAKMEKDFSILYKGDLGMVAHEMIVDFRNFKATAGIEVADVAKRLADYGFHAPTVSFPVAGTLMVEPTESEPKEELDRFIEAMIAIRSEISEIENGSADKEDNVLKNAPHTQAHVIDDNWSHPYSRTKAAYPLESLKQGKFWATCARVDEAYGDRNLVCTCPPIESYMED